MNEKPVHINAASIILGFTGSIGSGSTFIAKGIEEYYNQYKYFRLSTIIEDSLSDKGVKQPTIEQMQDEGNRLRYEKGEDYLADAIIKKIDSNSKNISQFYIIDGIKNEGEIQYLKQFPNFFLFSIHADRETRRKRCIKNQKFESEDCFDAADIRDALEETNFGQQVKKCNYLSDIIIYNNIDISEADHHKKEDFIRKIFRKYIENIEKINPDESNIKSTPDISELCMTIAYALSKKSSCLKRKVGAVIVDIESTTHGDDESECKRPYIVSTGYNDVPIGAKSCDKDPQFQRCARDIIQEQFARRIKFCPECGNIVTVTSECKKCGVLLNEYKKYCNTCHKELKIISTCAKCKIDVLKEFLPGSNVSSGKLLDMCRALHAEEVALLRLSRERNISNNFVLYTTTYPCTLCANKIVSIGIKKVVFAEPYPMEDATKILQAGKVELSPFEGVKSSAYFRIYS